MPARAVIVICLFGALAVACGGNGGTVGESAAGDVSRGRDLYRANCVNCHGPEGIGTGAGPPLVHEYYVPSHHADASFHIAVTRGVQPHHWNYGPMPPIEGLSSDDIDDIVAYVRELQREAGLLD